MAHPLSLTTELPISFLALNSKSRVVVERGRDERAATATGEEEEDAGGLRTCTPIILFIICAHAKHTSLRGRRDRDGGCIWVNCYGEFREGVREQGRGNADFSYKITR